MSRLSPFVPRPEDINCCFWDILLLLAGEPAFEFLREALSAPPGSLDEASSVDSPHRADVSVAETSEGGFGAAEDLPHEEERRGLSDDGEWTTGDQAPSSFSTHPVGPWSIQALRLLERSGHPRIWKIYNQGLLLFIAYRATVRFPSVWPIPGQQIRGFFLSLDSEGVSAPKILTYLSSLSYLSHTFNFQDPLQDLFTSHMIIRMKWQQEPPIPLTVETLESVLGALESVCDGIYECLMFGQSGMLQGTGAAQGKYAQMLFNELFEDYSNALRPVEDTDMVLNVTLQITLSQIKDMDERNQILTVYLWIRQTWYDAYLKWDKDRYDGLDSIRIPSNLVWRPDIVLYNNQQCNLTFGSWTYNGNQVDIFTTLDSGDLSDLIEDVEWEIHGMPAVKNVITYGCCSEPYPDVTFTLILKRKSSFYIFNLLLPCLLISFLAPLGFYLPADSGEKVSLGVTVLLSLTVFQLMWARVIILDYMSKIFFVYDVGENCTSLQCAKEQDAESAPAHPSPTEHGGYEERKKALPKGDGKDGDPPKKLMDGENEVNGLRIRDPEGCCSCYRALIQNIEYIADCVRRHKANHAKGVEWKKVAKVMDRFFMWIFFIMVFFMSVLVIGKAF
ncbi:hypothetical protein E2320_007930 [Naja naja]|nr:hypothetical protein E2320_007930 [Naja naja]